MESAKSTQIESANVTQMEPYPFKTGVEPSLARCMVYAAMLGNAIPQMPFNGLRNVWNQPQMFFNFLPPELHDPAFHDSLHSNFVEAIAHVLCDKVVEPFVYDLAGGRDTAFVGNFTVRQVLRPLVRAQVAGLVSLLINPFDTAGASRAALKAAVKYAFKTNGQIFPESLQELHVHRILAGASYTIVVGLAEGRFATPIEACELLWLATMKVNKEIFVSPFPLPSDEGYNVNTFIYVDWLPYVAGDTLEKLGPLVCAALVNEANVMDNAIPGAVRAAVA